MAIIEAGHTATRGRVGVAGVEREILRAVSGGHVLFARAGLPDISSLTVTPDHYRDTDKPESHVAAPDADVSGRSRSTPWTANLLTNASYPRWTKTGPIGSWTGTRHFGVRLPRGAAKADYRLRHRSSAEEGTTDGSDRSWMLVASDTNWDYYSVIVGRTQSGNSTIFIEKRTNQGLGNLVIAFAVTGSVRNVLTRHTADGNSTNIPLSPSTGATIQATEQDADFILTAYNNNSESSAKSVHYTYWTPPTLEVDDPVWGNSPFSNDYYIRFAIRRGGNPLPQVSVVASDGNGSDATLFDSGTSRTLQINSSRTGTARTVTYTFSAASTIGSESRSAASIVKTFTWPS